MVAIKRFSIALAVLVLLVMIASGICGCGGDEDKGQLPDIKVGDLWEYKNIQDGIEHQLTMEVIEGDEAGEWHTIKMTIDPPLEGMIDEATAGFDKELLLPLWTKMSGETEGEAFTAEIEATYEILSGSRWPIEVGKEITITESTTTDIKLGDETHTETETETKTHKVETAEEITVEAGTFECFRSVEYDEDGEKVSTKWHSDKVKTTVKEIDHKTGEIQELVSYSVK